MTEDIQQAIKILKSWHLIEFFQPYNIPEKHNLNQLTPKVTAKELADKKEALLPWLDPNARSQLGINPSMKVGYILYLGLFDKNQLEKAVKTLYGKAANDLEQQDWEERFESEGDTCYAKLMVNHKGIPNFEEMSVSTLPWALGRLQQHQPQDIHFEAFNDHCSQLKEQLDRINSQLPEHPDDPNIQILSANAITHLLHSLFDWADFAPLQTENFLFRLDWYKDNSKNNTVDETALPSPEEVDKTKISEDETLNDTLDNELIMPILNSFYIEDIERVVRHLQAGARPKALLRYLSSITEKHPDLYSEAGLQTIIHQCQPCKTPAGRWPSESQYNMSLMQQFAINTAFDALREGGLLSINGPPGTGKTTLLRDIIAQNIVARASVLANLNTVTDGIEPSGAPITALRGYEMVVASTNNAAVENISRELPLQKSIAPEFAEIQLLRPVANLLNAKRDKRDKRGFKPMPDEAQCWGTIAAVMGRKGNREEFKQRFFFDKYFDNDNDDNRPKEYNYLNFWRWRKREKKTVKSFDESKKHFQSTLEAFQQLNQKIEKLCQLMAQFSSLDKTTYLASAQAAVNIATAELVLLTQPASELKIQLDRLDEQIDIATLDLQQHNLNKPNIIQRIFQRQSARQYVITSAQLTTTLRDLKKDRLCLQKTQDAFNAQIYAKTQHQEHCEQTRQNASSEYDNAIRDIEQLQSQFDNIITPTPHDTITSDTLHKHAFWQSPSINKQRSKLFSAAIQLHESWILEASNVTAFRQKLLNIKELLGGKRFDKPQEAKDLWATVFLLIPVVSTTFASFARQFKDLDTEDLAWLMIDEAGQAAPQAAVGGLWRAKRVLVVGDPLQVEPVFTTPPKLVDYLSTRVLGQQAKHWSPHLWSVQQLADRVNAYGCKLNVMNKEEWIGIPLWVHRRCIEPMFSVANRIAYSNRMIHGQQPNQITPMIHPILGENRWFNSTGQCSHQQYVPAHGDVVRKMLRLFIQEGGDLNTLFIISPFKAVKLALKTCLADPENLGINALTMKRSAYYQWLNKHVGTVHTFQGQENQTVIFVLGCDQQNQGGARWASSKPNLLNVAITRSKQHFYVVGNVDIWGNKPFFSELTQQLQTE